MRSDSFIAVCLNPTLQKTLVFPKVKRDDVNRSDTYLLDVAGKGVNTARVLTQLGKRAVHLTHAGGAFLDVFLGLCAADDLDVRWADARCDIRFCYTVIDRNDDSVTELVEEGAAVAPGTEERIMELFGGLIGDCGTLVISGSKTPGYSAAVFPAMTRIAAGKGARIILDVRGADLRDSLPFRPTVIKPNLSEFVSTYLPGADQKAPGFKDDVAAAAAAVAKQYGCKVVLTRGASAVWMHDGASFSELAVDAVRPVNTVGSGDAFTAGLASALADGESLRDACAEGARCGRLNAGLLRCGRIR